ncbi:tape measure protein [Xenorhabdus bovienii]|uniref:tape measure protein n=1 Tax=Xenorhabdus bovienii TaxID=40576 RepID=UPI0023B2D583|nr:tape measure protein [Xenorhabdus bovienii]MDE9431355.1 tape measure protein [Xenorhabdus bovienii]MDE9442678.1 tape measure protein [Xenorhabdus bovienii]MDE9466379.1 tape measure protein [Xenorhabdus bovienii]MDE9488082.1 tape measure protein [Xenorhabdus bovienii]MDE9489207.1 tape measure protein [Xenorhabdus bovienii]
MAKLRELIIKISANSASFQSEIARASRMGADYHRTMENGGRRAAVAARGSSAALRDLNNQLVSVKDSAIGMTGAFAGIFATSKLVETADKWTNLNSRLKLATESSLDLAHSQRLLMEMSQKTGTSFEANATVFARAAAPMRALQYASQDIVNMTEALSTGLRISGASASESSSVLVQFSQAMSSGVLRGEEFNAMAENGSRIIQALAEGMGVARTQLKGMANDGLLTMDKVIPALLSQLEKLKAEGLSMGATVEKSLTRVQNAFMQWAGGANEATGTTRVLAGVLDDLSKNINDVAAAGAVAVGLFGARALGNRVSAIGASTSALIQNSRAEINNADQAYRNTQVQVASARASVRQAQQNVIAARSRMLQTTTTQTFAAAEARLNRTLAAAAAAQARVTQSINARAAAQARLNAVTSLGSRMGGALLGAVGGLPGILIMAAGAAYLLYQNQKQAKEEARAHAKEATKIKEELGKMNPIQLRDTKNQLKEDLAVAKEDLEEFKKEMTRNQISLNFFMKDKSQGKNVDGKITEFSTKLSESRSAYEAALKTVGEITSALTSLGDQQSINGEKEKRFITAINEMRKTGNVTLALQNQKLELTVSLLERIKNLGIDVSGIHVPVPVVKFEPNDKIKSLLKDQEREIDLSKRKGLDKVRREAYYKAVDGGLNPDDRQQKPYVNQVINNAAQVYQNAEALRKQDEAARKAQSEAESAARKAAKTAEDYTNKVAELNTQLATEAIRYKEGSAAAELFAASMASGKSFTQAQNSEISRLNQTLEEAKQKYQDLQDAISNDPFRNTAESAKKAREQLERQFKNKDVTPEEYGRRKDDIWRDEVKGNASARQQYAVSAREDLRGEVDPIQDLDNQLARKKALYDTYAETQIISEQRKNELIIAADNETNERRYEAAMQLYASQGRIQKMTVNLFVVTQERMSNILTGMLTGTQSFKEGMIGLFSSLTQSIIQNLMDMAAQAIVTNLILKSIMGVAGGVAGGASGGTTLANGQAVPMLPQNISVNAKGGVYDSPSLSAYSGQVVSTPTFFAFAKGAGLMGEAGPEAIMPLTRAADGSLGVRALMPAGVSAGTALQVSIVINDKGSDSTSSPGWEQFGSEIGRFVEQRYRTLIARDLGQGGILSNAIKGGR